MCLQFDVNRVLDVDRDMEGGVLAILMSTINGSLTEPVARPSPICLQHLNPTQLKPVTYPYVPSQKLYPFPKRKPEPNNTRLTPELLESLLIFLCKLYPAYPTSS